jgi:hypothetical protein
MSQHFIDQVFEYAMLEGKDLLVMLALAHAADNDGKCAMTVNRLAEMARLNCLRTMDRLKDLVEVGYLSIEVGAGKDDACTFCIHDLSADGILLVSAAETDERDEGDADLDDLASLFA